MKKNILENVFFFLNRFEPSKDGCGFYIRKHAAQQYFNSIFSLISIIYTKKIFI